MGAGSYFQTVNWGGGPGDLDPRTMTDWQKLRAAAFEGAKQSGSAADELVVEPLMSWEGALTMLGLTGLLLIPYVGEVVLVGLAGARRC